MKQKEQITAKIKEAKAKSKKRELELSKIRKALSTHKRRNLELQRINKAIKEHRLKKLNLATELLENDTMLESPDFKPGSPVFIVPGNDLKDKSRIALPPGEYTLKNKKHLIVKIEGIIFNIV